MTTPPDDLCVSENYTTFGMNQDTVTVWDPTGTVAAWEEGQTVDFYKLSVVMLPGAVLQWTPQGEDNWQDVPDVTAWHANGRFEIPEEFFAGKPENLCFRLKDAVLMDQRGIPPASLWNKIEKVLDSMDTWNGYLRGGLGSISHVWQAGEYYGYEGVEGNPCGFQFFETGITESDYDAVLTSSSFLLANTDNGGPEDAVRTAALSLVSSGFMSPIPITMVADGVEIVESKIEVEPVNVTRVLNGVSTDVDTGLQFTIMAVLPGNQFITVGSVATDATRRTVADITDIMRTMLANRNGQHPLGYVAIYSPVGYDPGMSMADFVPAQMDPEWETRESGPCEGTDRPSYTSGYYHDQLSWDGLNFGRCYIKFNWNGTDEHALVLPRWPSAAI